MTDERSTEGGARTGAAAPAGGSRGAGDAAPAPPDRGRKVSTGWLRTGGCLVALLLFVAALGVFALFYRRPTVEKVGGSAAVADAGVAAPVEIPPVRALALAPDASVVAVGGEELREGRWLIRFHRIEERRFVSGGAPPDIAAHEGPIRALAFRPGGEELFSASLDGTVGWWRVAAGERIASLDPPGPVDEGKGLLALAVSADGRYLAAGGWTGDVFVWDLEDPALSPLVFRGEQPPWSKDPKELQPAGHLDEVRVLAFAGGVPPLLFSGGADGLVVAWDLANRKASRIVGGDGKLPNVRALIERQIQAQRDRDFSITAMLPSPSRQGLFTADYRGCVYLVTTEGPCRGWWLGGNLAQGPVACIKPLLDRKKWCPGFDRNAEAGEPFLGLVPFPGLQGGFVGIAWNERFRIFRSADALPWRMFEGSGRRNEWMCGYAAAPEKGFLVTAGDTGHVRLYDYLGEPTAPDIRLGDSL
ncbi:MAG: hypothetical protein HY907_17880 [Deltaproteobacteria bacterium]|nr:hypothetical protein [Deltaproteobacteria bacterium]